MPGIHRWVMPGNFFSPAATTDLIQYVAQTNGVDGWTFAESDVDVHKARELVNIRCPKPLMVYIQITICGRSSRSRSAVDHLDSNLRF